MAICTRLINIRRELAQLLGHDTYADYVLEHRMASSVKNVYKLFNDLISAYKPQAIKELKEVEQLAKEMEGDSFEMQPWDFGYYSHKLQLQKYNIDSEMLRPYFELSKVIEGVFGLANRLYGISFKENNDNSSLPSRRLRLTMCLMPTEAILLCFMPTSTLEKESKAALG